MKCNDIGEFTSTNEKILRLVGLHPMNFPRYFTCVFFMSLIVVPEVIEIYLNRRDFDIVLETSSVLLTILLAISKSLMWMLRPETTNFVNFLIGDYWRIAVASCSSGEIREFAKSAKRVTTVYSILICNALLIFYSLPLIGALRSNFDRSTLHFPFVATYPHCCYHSPLYEIVYVSQMLATLSCAFLILGTDTLIATAILHSCGHFSILQRNFSKLNYRASSRKSLNYQLVGFIQHHQIVIRFSARMEALFNPLMLLQVFASSLIICLVVFQINSGNVEKIPQYCSYLMMAFFQLLLFCWPGDELIRHSSNVGKMVHFSNWYEASKSIKSKINLIIHRSQKPCFLTAGKFHAMTLENFSTILSTSVSYFMLLRSFSED